MRRLNFISDGRFGFHKPAGLTIALCVAVILAVAAGAAQAWDEAAFAHSPFFGYPVPQGRNAVIGQLSTYTIKKGDTLLDVGRWYGLTAKEISDANNHMDWWTPPVGQTIILPTEHILPTTRRIGIVLNIPEMRLYYYYPPPRYSAHKSKMRKAAYSGKFKANVVYTFPVGLGRFDWKTPIGQFHVTAKTHNPTWVVPDDIYKEHLERDGEAEHVVYGGDPDNPLGHYRLSLSLPEYAIHGTNVPWGVGMEVSHGCVRLYPEDIDRLYHLVPVGAPGRFVYQPIKFGWRGDALYVEVHSDLYNKYPSLWDLALKLVARNKLQDAIDMDKLRSAVAARTGVPTYVMAGASPDGGLIPTGLSASSSPAN